ncbi:unnamed protein product [Sphagnum jensenii]|uniref:NAD-dependent epimerase/dehydratase domain-containing protein n=1 Tax=Sphagnum jensenii TaxID=128206 RepID=A0ABP0V8M3_9BRYO
MSAQKILVVGGAGYVGSAACAWLLDQGHDVWVLDDLSTGHRELVLTENFVKARAGDRKIVLPLLKSHAFDGVMHFAAKSLVEESVQKPELYWENNVEQTQALIEMMIEAGVKRLVFSSTCAIFGDPKSAKIDENLPKNPINPYGKTKLEVEKLLETAVTRGLQSIALRYFNAAGAEPKLRAGEWHVKETHLIPRTLKASALGSRVEIFGHDYSTPDGTCVRDYIHVSDLAAAHGAAMNKLQNLEKDKGFFGAYNLGSENGYSVRQVVDAVEKVIGKKISRADMPRRAGDPPVLVSNSEKAKRELAFKPKHDLNSIVQTAWDWEQKLKKGIRRAVFLDRDETINEDPGYLDDPEKVKLLPGVGEALGELKKAGYLLVVVTNQSGVGRGLISLDALVRIHERLNELLKKFGAEIDHFECCVHHPDANCDCRKPKPKLLQMSADYLGIDLSRSFMVGDRHTDVMAGIAAGCQGSIFLKTDSKIPNHPHITPTQVSFIADNFKAAADWILSRN